MSDTFPVTPVPYLIFRAGQNANADTLINLGPDNVYVDTQPQVTTTQGFLLSPNAMYPVEANQYLSVVCPTASSVQLLGRSGLNFWDPNQLATAINLIGVPPIDRAQLISTETFSSVPVGNPWNTQVFDISGFNTIDLFVNETNGADGSVTNALRKILVFYFSDAAGTHVMAVDAYYHWPSGGGIIAGPTAAKGPFIKIIGQALAVGAVASVTYSLFASMRTTANNKIETTNKQVGAGFLANDGDDGTAIMVGTIPVGTTKEFPKTYAGPATITASTGATITATTTIGIVDPLIGATLAAITFPVATVNRWTTSIYLTERPVVFSITNGNAAGLAAAVVLMMDGNRY
jgi:hypothetical protein